MLSLLWRNARRNQLIRNDENTNNIGISQRNTKVKSTKNRQHDNNNNNTTMMNKKYGVVQVMELAWEDHAQLPVDIQQQTWQYIIASDCIYNEHIVAILVKTMRQLAHSTTLVLIAQELRSDTVHEAFLEQLLLFFNVWRVVPVQEQQTDIINDDPLCVVIYMAKLKQ
jgi:predicted nicotinamide N-methyase